MPTMTRAHRGQPLTPPPADIFTPTHVERLRAFNNKHEGQRGFLVGGGSSISEIQQQGFDFHHLEQDVIVGVNKAYLLLSPQYLVFGDEKFWKAFKEEVCTLSCIKFCPQDILRGYYKDETLLPLRRGTNYNEVLPRGLHLPVSFINNTGVAALRILYCLGCNPIYLVGIDLQPHTETQATHFHNDYLPLGRKPRIESYKGFHTEFTRTVTAIQVTGRSLFSCSSFSKLNNLIPYIPLPLLFDSGDI